MQKWEYKIIDRKREIHVFKAVKWDVEIESMLPQLGDDGWELVGITSRSSQWGENSSGFTSDETWVFKRPKE